MEIKKLLVACNIIKKKVIAFNRNQVLHKKIWGKKSAKRGKKKVWPSDLHCTDTLRKNCETLREKSIFKEFLQIIKFSSCPMLYIHIEAQ